MGRSWAHRVVPAGRRRPGGNGLRGSGALGARVGYVGVAGNDQNADLKLQSFRESGVDLSRLIVRNGPETHVVVVWVRAKDGERAFSGLGHFRNAPIKVEELDRDYITSGQFLHLDGFDHEAAVTAAQWMHAAGKKVSYDASKTDGRPIQPEQRALVPLVDILICGSGFGSALTGRSNIWDAGKAMLDMGPSIVVQTEGEDGSYTTTTGESFHTPAFKVDVVDTTGAGDVYHGAYLVGLLHGWDLHKTATFATAVSAIECTKLGGRCGIPSFADVMAFLHQHGIEIE